MSLRSSVTSELVLQDVRSPTPPVAERDGAQGAARLPDPGPLRHRLGSPRLGHGLPARAVEYSKDRVQFDRPIGGFQLTQAKLADMITESPRGSSSASNLAG